MTSGGKPNVPPDLPGADLIAAGIAALQRGERTQEALLVAVAPNRLEELGLSVPPVAFEIDDPNMALYAAVHEGGGGHSQYNGLLRRLSSFIRAASQVRPAGRRELGSRTEGVR